MRSIRWAGWCGAVLTVIGLSGAGTAAAAPTASSSAPAGPAAQALTVSGGFDKPSYVTGETVTATMTVHNPGTSAVAGVNAQQDSGSSQLFVDQHGFGVLGGVTIAAGKSVTVTVSGQLPSAAATSVVLSGYLYDGHGDGLVSFSFRATAKVRTATVSGQVYGDANANGRADPGEGLSGATLELSYAYDATAHRPYSITTGADGRFRATVPTTSYYLNGSGDGQTVIPQQITVGAQGSTLSLRAVRPLGDALQAKMHFTADTYAPGDTVHLVVTLTNRSDSTLRGIGALCDRAGDPDELINRGAGWGELAIGAGGVTLAAHDVDTIQVTDTVPAAAQRSGVVFAGCDFGYEGIDSRDRPEASASARVPGQSGAVGGEVVYYPHGHGGASVGVAHARVLLADPTTCPVLTRSATTDADGHFRIADAPAGPFYKLYVYPPAGFKVKDGNPTTARVFGHDTSHFGIEVVHGSATVPAVPTCSPTPPAPPAGPPLASTGIDAGGLTGIGAALLVLGVALAGLGRRRTPA